MARTMPCKAVLHSYGTINPCAGTAGHGVHWSLSGYRWVTSGRVLNRPASRIDQAIVDAAMSADK